MASSQMLKVGVVLSAGGSAFFAALAKSGLPADRFHIITDRPCQAEEYAKKTKLSHARISIKDRNTFSRHLREELIAAKCDIALLHFSRLVSDALFTEMPTFNVHPSFLPAYPGMNSVKEAERDGAGFQGCTLHLVDAGMDTGPIVTRTAQSLQTNAGLAWRKKISFGQKALMTMALFDLVLAGRVDPSRIGLAAVDLSGTPFDYDVNHSFLNGTMATAAYELWAEITRDCS